MDCLFCKIINKAIPADITYEDEHVLAFNDISPQAPVHQLIIPKLHISTLNDLTEAHTHTIGQMLLAAKQLAAQHDLSEAGYRTVFNCNEHGGQTVFHIHLHLLGGRSLSWPPG